MTEKKTSYEPINPELAKKTFKQCPFCGNFAEKGFGHKKDCNFWEWQDEMSER
jgi:hypothetical protein